MRSRIRTEPRHPAATSRSCEPSFAVQQTPVLGIPESWLRVMEELEDSHISCYQLPLAEGGMRVNSE